MQVTIVHPMTNQRKRKQVAYRLDSLMLEALSSMAEECNMSANRYLETLIYENAMKKGLLPPDTKMLGETRGGGAKNND